MEEEVPADVLAITACPPPIPVRSFSWARAIFPATSGGREGWERNWGRGGRGERGERGELEPVPVAFIPTIIGLRGRGRQGGKRKVIGITKIHLAKLGNIPKVTIDTNFSAMGQCVIMMSVIRKLYIYLYLFVTHPTCGNLR